jgi:hypothetical protein
MFCAVGSESGAVKSAQSFDGTKPEEASRISHNALDAVVSQTVCNCVTLDGQLLGIKSA